MQDIVETHSFGFIFADSVKTFANSMIVKSIIVLCSVISHGLSIDMKSIHIICNVSRKKKNRK